ncbi:hypothetical protein [Phaeobacter inhibens]|uniref:hypothetical protein n=1 Tax=Phaeobacter inhibens TaxID=221822 RepID=UPI00076BB875|nr:hypothetical protein [Phaeobacter inhibens]KXF89960.1 hypothetical protein AT574_13995 [Phaeobacter inhibens]WHP70205.1 hypothetical protein QMZ01_08560 [Phaeobacter inhibens]
MTQKRAPKWQRQGYRSDEEYRAACSATKKTRRAAMAATKAEYTTARVLEKMWDEADFDKPRVTITKEQLMGLCRCSLWSVKRALIELREEGSVKPYKGWEGGRGKPTTWWLSVPGGASTPVDDQIERMEAKRDREAAWNFLKGKYGPLKALELMGDPEDSGI